MVKLTKQASRTILIACLAAFILAGLPACSKKMHMHGIGKNRCDCPPKP